MKYQILSDIHSEFHTRESLQALVQSLNPTKEARIALVAGDLKTQRCGKNIYLMLADQFPYVVSVLGNHDIWGGDFATAIQETKNLPSNVCVLENDKIKLGDGPTIHGCTGWFPEVNYKVIPYSRRTNDYNYIKLLEPWVYEQNQKSKEYLEQNVQQNDIVLMHYIPADFLVHPRWKGYKDNIFFVAGFDDIAKNDPSLVVWGHTHTSTHLTLGKTQYVCNPYGYFGRDINQDFQPELVVNL